MPNSDDLTIDHQEIREFVIKPVSSLTFDKKLLNALLYSHFHQVGWFLWTEIESVEMNGDEITFHYKEPEESNTL